jgi:hypothetical protein
MHFSWTLAITAVVAFVAALALQSQTQVALLQRTIKSDKWAETVEDYARLTRQDTAGILISSMITNALLVAILAVLIIRP